MFNWNLSNTVRRIGSCYWSFLVPAFIACSSGHQVPGMAQFGSAGGQRTKLTTLTCAEGDTRKCSVTLAQHGDTLSCLYGTQTCSGSVWSGCEHGTVALMSARPRSDRSLASLTDQPSPCQDNPCDPSCQTYSTVPSSPIVANTTSNVSWWTGTMSTATQNRVSVSNCESAANCQQNQMCTNVATDSTCAHNKCQVDTGLSATGCGDACVQSICAANPACCPAIATPKCQAGEISDGAGQCYYHDPVLRTWFDARQNCKSRGQGWDLACISTTAIQNLIASNNTTDSWIGLERTSNSASSPFVCANQQGTPLNSGQQSVYPWNTGEPNFWGGLESCAEIYAASGLWNDYNCSNLVASWCQGPATDQNDWSQACVDAVATTCGAFCDPNGTNQSGTCTAWAPGGTNSADASFDLSIDVPCNGQVPLCNHGTQPAPAGMVIQVLPADDPQFGISGPDLNNAMGSCTSTETIAPGACIMVDGCSTLLLQNDASLWVTSPTGGESRVDDNWGYSTHGAACVIPHCLLNAGSSACVSARTYQEDYRGTCPDDQDVPQWSFLEVDANTPGDSSIRFQIAAAVAPDASDDLSTATLTDLAIVAHAKGNEQCLLSGPAPNCPIDLYKALQPIGAANAALIRLVITLIPSSDGTQSPVLSNWRVSYACPAAT